MSALTSCPKCFHQVSLPAGDDCSVWVRCPLCGAQYPLQTAIDFVPPALQIIPAPAFSEVGHEHTHGHAEHAENQEFRFADEHPIGGGEFGDVEELAHHVDGRDSHALGAIATMAYEPPKTKKKVPLAVRLIGIGIFIAFGLLGCLIVYSAFLYFGMDQFGVHQYFPDWIVAKSLREPQPPKQNKNSNRDAKPSISQGPTEAGPDAGKRPNPNSPDAAGDQKSTQALGNSPTDQAKPTESIGPKSDLAYSLDDLTAAVDAARQSSGALAEAVKEGDDVKLQTARIANYRVMSHLATVLTFVNAPDANAANQVDALKTQIATFLAERNAAGAPAERDLIGGFARVGIHSPNRKESGLFAAGTLKKTEAHGRLFESQFELPGGSAPITVVTAQKPSVEVRSPILLLGAIVNDPATNLAGYDGSADMVVFGEVLVAPTETAAAPSPASDATKKPLEDAAKPSGDATK